MALSDPASGLGDPLRRLRNKTKQPAKVFVTVAPGDELEVSSEVAAQLDAATTAFESVSTPPDVSGSPTKPKPQPRRRKG